MDFKQTAYDLFILKQSNVKKYNKELDKIVKKTNRSEIAYILYLIDKFDDEAPKRNIFKGGLLCN